MIGRKYGESHGKVQEVGWADISFSDRFRNLQIYLQWRDGWDGEELCFLYLPKEEAKRVIKLMEDAIEDMDTHETKMREIISKTNFTKLYSEFERKYNPYPIQMARYEAFGKALADNLIDRDTYEAAAIYYGNLWNYVGD